MDPNATPDVQAPDVNQVAPQTAQPPDMGAAPAQAVPAPSQTPAQHSSKWAAVAEGALHALQGAGKGLLLGGIPGAVTGAVSPKTVNTAWNRQQQSAQAGVDMQKAQSASLLAEAHQRETMAQQMPEELQLRFKENDEKIASDYIARGISPTVVTHDQSPEAALDAAKKVLGDGTHVVVLRYGNGYAAFDLNGLAQAPGALNDVNDMRVVRGNAPITTAQWNNRTMLNPGAKSQQMKDASTFYNPVPAQSLGAVDGQLTAYKNYLATAQSVPDAKFPNKDQRVAQLKTAVQMLQDQKDNLRKEQQVKTDQTIRAAEARQASRRMPVINADGSLGIARADVAEKNGLAPASQGMKAGSSQAQIGDIQTGSQAVRSDVMKLDTPLSPSQVALLTQAVHSNDEKIMSASISALNKQNMTPAQKQFVVDIAQLHERALSLRAVAGMGQSSDMMRAAIFRILPSAASGDRDMMLKQLDAFDQQVKVLGTGIPKVKGLGPQASAPASSGPKAGTVEGGYRFKGGDPADKNNWEKQ